MAGRGAIASAVRRLPEVRGPDRTPLDGHARIFVHPAYVRLVNSEPYVKRLIPLLIIIFVLALGSMRGLALYQERETVGDHARVQLALVVKSISNDLEDAPSEVSLAGPSEALQSELESVLSAFSVGAGRQIMILDPQGMVVAASPRHSELLGRYADEILGPAQPLTTLHERAGVLPITLPSGEDVIATVHRTGQEMGAVAVVQPLSAVFAGWRERVSRETTVFVATSVVLVILGFAFHAQAARAQEADFIYGETQSRFHMALRRGHSGLWDWDLSRGAVFWSKSMFEILGLEPANRLLSIGEVTKLIHPDDSDLVEIANGFVEARCGQLDREFRMRHADGHWIWVRARTEVVCDNDDDPHLVGIAVDVTEQKRLAEASRTADLRLRDAIEAISEAFVLWDTGNRLVMCNSKYQQLYGLPDELVRPGTSYEEILKKGRSPIVSSAAPSKESGVGARSVEARTETGRWLQINERRTKDGGFVSVGTDITALKQHSAQLVENEATLTATVADLRRSRQQLERQAQQLVELAEKYAVEKDKAEDASRTKSEFLANVSHELRTPLNAIIGFSEMMLSGVFGSLGDEKYDEYCRDIRESGRFLLRVISDILDMARLEAGRVEIEREIVSLGEIIAEAAEAHEAEAERGGVQLLAEPEADLAISADKAALRQILGNLVSNAIKFTPQGGKVSVSAERTRGGVALTVTDSGIGIPRSALAKLGRPFEQVQSQMTRSHKGSGLGLAITYSLVALHGGEMEIESSPGAGTTVTIFFPADPDRRHAAA